LGTSVPEAVLSDADGNIVGVHFAGPTWESNSGSKVVGVKLAASTANPPVDPNEIPWLLLQAKSSEGPGIFANITYVQRVSTAGGKAPATAELPDKWCAFRTRPSIISIVLTRSRKPALLPLIKHKSNLARGSNPRARLAWRYPGLEK